MIGDSIERSKMSCIIDNQREPDAQFLDLISYQFNQHPSHCQMTKTSHIQPRSTKPPMQHHQAGKPKMATQNSTHLEGSGASSYQRTPELKQRIATNHQNSYFANTPKQTPSAHKLKSALLMYGQSTAERGGNSHGLNSQVASLTTTTKAKPATRHKKVGSHSRKNSHTSMSKHRPSTANGIQAIGQLIKRTTMAKNHSKPNIVKNTGELITSSQPSIHNF